MPNEPRRQRRSYDEMVKELHALIGSHVTVEIALLMSRATRPLASMLGKLTSGQTGDFARDFPRDRPPLPSGESIAFYIEHRDPGAFSAFVLTRDGFKLGFREADETLAWQSGQAKFVVWRDEDAT